jgi:hypothetical protein
MNPHTESTRLLELSARHTALSEESKGIVRRKAGVWKVLRQHTKSVADADREWEGTEDGIREKELKIEMNSIESQMSAVKVWLRQQELEARNLQ